MKMTLLAMVQDILASMDSDDVNSISDTSESWQVALVVNQTYFDTFLNRQLPEQEGIIKLQGSGDVTRPTHMQLPDTAGSIKWIKYDWYTSGAGSYMDVQYMTPEEFLFKQINTTAGQNPTIKVTDYSGATFLIYNKQNPKFWTSFDDKHIVMDGFSSTLENTLQASKSLCWGQNNTTFAMTDDAVPPLDDNLFPLLLAEAKSTCFVNFKQLPNAKEEQKAKRQLVRSQRFLWRAKQRETANGGYDLPDFSRIPK